MTGGRIKNPYTYIIHIEVKFIRITVNCKIFYKNFNSSFEKIVILNWKICSFSKNWEKKKENLKNFIWRDEVNSPYIFSPSHCDITKVYAQYTNEKKSKSEKMWWSKWAYGWNFMGYLLAIGDFLKEKNSILFSFEIKMSIPIPMYQS